MLKPERRNKSVMDRKKLWTAEREENGMKPEYIEKIYAGWLAKIIGIRYGAPIEGDTYEQIKNRYGELDDYIVDYRDFAADDDSNGPLFFLRALEDGRHGFDVKAQDVAEALLNYAPFEHGFFWWGGYGVSTEHTAYLNLRNGIPAPRSGSIEQNGATAAEQIGGQIFIDTWGLVSPGNPDQAACFAKEAASVTHGGNGVYGGIFVAVCISWAFVEQDIYKIIEKGLSYIPKDCEYARAVRAVMAFYEQHPENWRDCYQYIYENFGYDKYPGVCHIIPNISVMILGLLYGEGDFGRTLSITNMCGWDTDCNVGNIATIMGVRNGLEGIEYEKWRKPINDFLACSSVVGSLNIMDIPYGAVYIAKLAYALAGEKMPEPWNTIAEERIDSCHFEFPGSTHAIRTRVEAAAKEDSEDPLCGESKLCRIENTTESAATGTHSLKLTVPGAQAGDRLYAYRRTYYQPKDFHDNRYSPCFSPILYPGQKIHCSAYLPEGSQEAEVSLYVKELHSGCIYEGEKQTMTAGSWLTLHYDIPKMESGLLSEMGVCIRIRDEHAQGSAFTAMIDDLYADGVPEYTIEFADEQKEQWTNCHWEISQFTKLKGLIELVDGEMQLSCADFAEAYTGRYDWEDYQAEFSFTPLMGEHHMVNVRVQGAIRSYAVGLLPDHRIAVLKNDNGYRVLKEAPFAWENGVEYTIGITAIGNEITAAIDGTEILKAIDTERPYLQGSIGVALQKGSRGKYRRIAVKGIEKVN